MKRRMMIQAAAGLCCVLLCLSVWADGFSAAAGPSPSVSCADSSLIRGSRETENEATYLPADIGAYETPAIDPVDGYNRLDGVRLTHYCICRRCCGKGADDPGYGITASGRRAVPEVTAAVDTAVIPLGAEIVIGYADGTIIRCRADDTGVKGQCVDLCVESHEEAIERGVEEVTVWWREE